ncbi:DUF58 domain-containing protein [Paenibacillus sp. WLX1005]|uniref:DUF58 domain-containing protein n=1 Tax=Paenibacillus sp. WLX1005 TaxID=3243766 RepID=UPI0039845F52
MELFWLVVVAVLVVIGQAFVFGRRSLSRLHYRRRLSTERCHVGERIEMIEELENRSRLPLPWLRLEAMLPVAFQFAGSADTVISEGTVYQNHNSLFSLARQVRIVRRHHMVCRQRGCYRLDSASMSVGDLFGLVRVNRPVQLNLSMCIYPAYLPLEHMPEAYRSWQGEVEMRRWINEDPFLITGVRPYRSGDPMNQVHWGATARTGKMQVFQHGYSADPEVIILLNIELNEQMWSTVTEPVAAEYGISCAATVAANLIDRGMKAGFGHNAIIPSQHEHDAVIAPAYGSEQLTSMLQMMAELQLKIRRPFVQFLGSFLPDNVYKGYTAATAQPDLLIITPYVSTAMQDMLNQLEASGSRISLLPLPDLDQIKQQYNELVQQG